MGIEVCGEDGNVNDMHTRHGHTSSVGFHANYLPAAQKAHADSAFRHGSRAAAFHVFLFASPGLALLLLVGGRQAKHHTPYHNRFLLSVARRSRQRRGPPALEF